MPDTMRHVYTSSSCGICGTDSIEAVRKTLHFDPSQDELQIPLDVVAGLPELLRGAQALFEKTGGVHAAGLFRVDGPSPELLCLREDVGRHNAVDKVVGWALRQDLLPLTGTVLQVSGRASFELVQKAALAGIPALAAVSAALMLPSPGLAQTPSPLTTGPAALPDPVPRSSLDAPLNIGSSFRGAVHLECPSFKRGFARQHGG